MNILAVSNLLGYDAVYIGILSLHSIDCSNPEYCGASYSETSTPIFKSMEPYPPKNLKLHHLRCENLRPCVYAYVRPFWIRFDKFISH